MDTLPNTHAVSQDSTLPRGRAWWENPGLLGLMLSVCLHLALLVVLAPIIIGAAPGGGEGDGVTAALPSVTESELTGLTEATLPVPSVGDELASQADAMELPIDAAPAEGTGEEVGLLASGLAGGTGGSGTARGIGLSAAGGGGSARFFGVEARGARFAFVVDVSGSMNQDRKLEALKEALLSSVDGLLEQTSVCIIVYSGDAYSITGSNWLRADRGREEARRAILSLSATGPTNPMPGFDIAFGLTPRPDAIYFMTDGVFEKSVDDRLPAYVERLNRAAETPTALHCITFVDRGSERLMRRLARSSGGTYTHVEAARR